ncbi:MAG: HD domain-containing phosphohydrolase [Negativicutes bacterium]
MPDPRHKSVLAGFRRRKIPAIFFLFPAFCLVVIGLAWYEVSARVEREYQLEIDSIYRESDNLARSFEDHVLRNLHSVNDTLLYIKMQYENLNEITPALMDQIQKRRNLLVEEIHLLDPTGKIIAGAPKVAQLKNPVLFEIYNAHAKSDSGQLFIGKPIFDHIYERWSVPVSRRLNNEDGSFAGVAYAALNPSYFSDYYRQMVLGYDKQVALVGHDGIIRALQHKYQTDVGQAIGASKLFPAWNQSLTGRFEDIDSADRVHRYYTYRSLLEYPLIISIGAASSDALEKFETRRSSYYTDTIIFTLFVSIFCLLLTVQLVRQRFATNELQRRNKLLSFLHETSLGIMNRRDVVDLLETIINKASEITGASTGSVLLFNEARTERIRVIATGPASSMLGSRNAIDEGAAGEVWKTGQTVLINDYKKWEHRTSPADTLAEAVVYFPLKSAGEVVGIIGLWHTEAGCQFQKDDIAMLDQIANLASIAYENAFLYREAQREITDRKQTEELLQYQNFHDTLTCLYNRTYFEEEMQRIDKRTGGSVGLIMLDLDGLKLINDTLGHEQGDVLLASAAHILSVSFRSTDVVARIGGDEFAVLLHPADEVNMQSACDRIRKKTQEVNSQQSLAPISLSIGYALAADPSMPMRELFQRADNNMYREKLHRRQSTRSAIVQTVMKLLEARDYITEGHADRLQAIIARMGADLSFSAEKISDLRLFAQFHDIGKVGIPDHILLKPGPLTPEEKTEMQRHSEIGHRIAQSAPDLLPIADWVLKHHEWWNGLGYPLGLSGEEIPVECRILAIADAYDAMTSERPYRQPVSHDEALSEILNCAGTQFDPELAGQFINLYGISGPDEKSGPAGKEGES